MAQDIFYKYLIISNYFKTQFEVDNMPFMRLRLHDNGFRSIEQALGKNKLGHWDDYGKADRWIILY